MRVLLFINDLAYLCHPTNGIALYGAYGIIHLRNTTTEDAHDNDHAKAGGRIEGRW